MLQFNIDFLWFFLRVEFVDDQPNVFKLSMDGNFVCVSTELIEGDELCQGNVFQVIGEVSRLQSQVWI